MNVSRVVPRDAIPSVDGPSLGERHDGAAADTVIAVEGGERPRAFPVRHLPYHDIANDTIDDDPCPTLNAPRRGSWETGRPGALRPAERQMATTWCGWRPGGCSRSTGRTTTARTRATPRTESPVPWR
jgi:hypothetical protein